MSARPPSKPPSPASMISARCEAADGQISDGAFSPASKAARAPAGSGLRSGFSGDTSVPSMRISPSSSSASGVLSLTRVSSCAFSDW